MVQGLTVNVEANILLQALRPKLTVALRSLLQLLVLFLGYHDCLGVVRHTENLTWLVVFDADVPLLLLGRLLIDESKADALLALRVRQCHAEPPAYVFKIV